MKPKYLNRLKDLSKVINATIIEKTKYINYTHAQKLFLKSNVIITATVSCLKKIMSMHKK